jgi:hypothetical protein
MAKVLAYTSPGQVGEVDITPGAAVHVPFYLADGTATGIALTADNKLPFFLASGSAADIALTT